MRYHPVPVRLFSDRRRTFIKKMKPDALAIFYSNDLMPRSGDQFFPFHQDSTLFALSGLDQPGTIIVLFPGAKKKSDREIVFILPDDPEHRIWNGERLSIQAAKKISGISMIRTIDQWDKIMPSLFNAATTIYINSREQDRFQSSIPSQNDRKAEELKRLYPSHIFLHAQPLLRQLSMIKSPEEIELMKHAVKVTGLAFDEVLRSLTPGMKEYEVEAHLSYTLTRHGCQHTFEPIIASGVAACTLHYTQNDRLIRSGSLVLLDFGAAYAYMCSDMSRTIPASGRFSERQRKIYQSVLHVLNEVTAMMHPGILIEQLNVEAGKLIESELIKLKILTKQEIRRQEKSKPLWKKYFMHGIGHHLGFDVHDISDRSVPLKTGMVLTCEPGLYLPKENIGIRLENDILITRKGPQNLMAGIPLDPDEIESIMQSVRK